MKEREFTIDRSESQVGIEINVPSWFVNPMRAYLVRNSINTDPRTFAFYCTSTYEVQKDWLTAENIGLVLQKIVGDLKFPRLPADCDWEKYRPKESSKDILFLQEMGKYLEEMTTRDCIAPKPELDARQMAAINYCGGFNGLLQYAKNYSVASANRYLENALSLSIDYKFAEKIAPDQERIGKPQPITQIGDLLKGTKNGK